MKKIFIFFIIFSLFSMAGFTNKNKTKIGIRGTITSMELIEDNIIIDVSGKKEKDTLYDCASVTITKDTLITENKKNIEHNKMRTSLIVEIIFEENITESYPVQANAKLIRILGT